MNSPKEGWVWWLPTITIVCTGQCALNDNWTQRTILTGKDSSSFHPVPMTCSVFKCFFRTFTQCGIALRLGDRPRASFCYTARIWKTEPIKYRTGVRYSNGYPVIKVAKRLTDYSTIGLHQTIYDRISLLFRFHCSSKNFDIQIQFRVLSLGQSLFFNDF